MLSTKPYELPGQLAKTPSASRAQPIASSIYKYDAALGCNLAAIYYYDANDIPQNQDAPNDLYHYDDNATPTCPANSRIKWARQRPISTTPQSHKHRRPPCNQPDRNPRRSGAALPTYYYDAHNHPQTGDNAIYSANQPTPSEQSATRTSASIFPGATVVIQYNYGPFGELIRATGPMAKANPFRFSTKFTDDESDFVYYGYRYYNPSTGRWLNRDPLGDIAFSQAKSALFLSKLRTRRSNSMCDGSIYAIIQNQALFGDGANVYQFVHEDPVNQFDAFGLTACTDACDQQFEQNMDRARCWAKKAGRIAGVPGAFLGGLIGSRAGSPGLVIGGLLGYGSAYLGTYSFVGLSMTAYADYARGACYLGCMSVEGF